MIRLRIVSVNDVYTLENLPRLKNLVRHAREVDPADATLVIVAGDFLAPSLLSSLDAGRAMIACLNEIGVTHVVMGNHEDDVPIAELRQRVGELDAVWLGTNVHGFEPELAASDVVTVTGGGGRSVRVGLVGVLMTDPAVYRLAPFGGARLEPANEAAVREARRLLSGARCDCVIPVTHQSIAEDRELARAAVVPPFPVVVGGHEHVVFTENVEGTWIVKAGSDAKLAAVTELAWDDAGALAVTVRMEPVAAYPEDAALRARVDAAMVKVHALETATLYKLAPGEALSSVGSRARPTTMGSLVCSRLRDALGAEAAIFNGGGIRAGREYPARFTYGDLKSELPRYEQHPIEVVVARLPGRVLAEAVAASRAAAPAESGAYLQVDDRMRVDEPGHVVTAVAGAPLDPERLYCVATVRELLTGMDHIEPLARWGREQPAQVPPAGSGREVKLVLVESFAVTLWHRLGGFDQVDANHDGRVSASEIAEAIARVNAEAPSSVAAQLVLQALDVDHAGAITREEAARLDPRDE